MSIGRHQSWDVITQSQQLYAGYVGFTGFAMVYVGLCGLYSSKGLGSRLSSGAARPMQLARSLYDFNLKGSEHTF